MVLRQAQLTNQGPRAQADSVPLRLQDDQPETEGKLSGTKAVQPSRRALPAGQGQHDVQGPLFGSQDISHKVLGYNRKMW